MNTKDYKSIWRNLIQQAIDEHDTYLCNWGLAYIKTSFGLVQPTLNEYLDLFEEIIYEYASANNLTAEDIEKIW